MSVVKVEQYKQEEREGLERWAAEAGIDMEQLEDQILDAAERAVERRSAARLAADRASLLSRLAAHFVQEAQAENVVSIFPET
ncbi:hypothetical protein NUH87_26675 [Pseudomonas batumici]|uniref:hypothetical protein n=1 Tax=Pseudomonas batumici TaxID=226910 RepID=UPI0030CB0387